LEPLKTVAIWRPDAMRGSKGLFVDHLRDVDRRRDNAEKMN